MKKEKIEIRCRTCKKEILLEVRSFGDGYIGICPKCDGVAYNQKNHPLENK